MSVHLHLGVPLSAIPKVEQTLAPMILPGLFPEPAHAARATLEVDGGWEEWGEPIHEPPNDGVTAHVVTVIPHGCRLNLPLALHGLDSLGLLVQNRDGVMAVTTSPDHAEGVITWRRDAPWETFLPYFY